VAGNIGNKKVISILDATVALQETTELEVPLAQLGVLLS